MNKTGPFYIGCFTDYVNEIRDLNGPSTHTSTNTIESCIGYCLSNGFAYAGVENG